MTDNVDRLGTRMVELNNALQDKRTNPDFAFEDINSALEANRAELKEMSYRTRTGADEAKIDMVDYNPDEESAGE